MPAAHGLVRDVVDTGCAPDVGAARLSSSLREPTLNQFIACLALVMALAAAAPGAAQRSTTARPVGQERADVVENWVKRLRLADQALQAGEWKAAKRTVEFLLDEMQGRITGGESAGRFLAFACLYRAIAESGLGNEREAAWDFGMAQSLHAEFAKSDFTPYGKAGAALDAARRAEAKDEEPRSVAEVESPEGSASGGITRPVKLRAPPPTFPYGKSQACDTESVVVQLIIRKDGLPSAPVILTKSDPVLAFSAMDAIRNWKFRPGELNGKPVFVYYNITVNFRQMYCPNPAAIAAGAKP